MQAMIAKFNKELKEFVAAKPPFSEVVAALIRLKGQGLTRSDAEETLNELRQQELSEELDDYVLDCVTGFCSPDIDVWGPADSSPSSNSESK